MKVKGALKVVFSFKDENIKQDNKVLLRLHMKIIKFHYEGYEVPVNANELYDFIDLVEGKNFIKVLIIS